MNDLDLFPDRSSVDQSHLPVVSASSIRRRVIRWLWRDRISIPTTVLLAGRGGVGKSTLAASIAAHVTGGPSLDPASKDKRLGSVLWLSAEENLSVVTRPRLDVAGAKLKSVYFPGVDDTGQVQHAIEFPSDLAKLQDLACDLGVKLIVVDPLASYCPSVDLNQQQPVRALMAALKLVSERVGLSWLLIAHPNKSKSGNVLDRIFASKSLVDAARSVLLVGNHPDGSDKRVVVHGKTNEGPLATTLGYRLVADDNKGVPAVRWIGPQNVTADMLGIEALDAGGTDEHLDARTLLQSLIGDDWRPAQEILTEARRTGIGETTLRKAKAELGVPSKRVDNGLADAHWEWGIPPNGWPKGETK